MILLIPSDILISLLINIAGGVIELTPGLTTKAGELIITLSLNH
jgi:hypothetical protein